MATQQSLRRAEKALRTRFRAVVMAALTALRAMELHKNGIGVRYSETVESSDTEVLSLNFTATLTPFSDGQKPAHDASLKNPQVVLEIEYTPTGGDTPRVELYAQRTNSAGEVKEARLDSRLISKTSEISDLVKAMTGVNNSSIQALFGNCETKPSKQTRHTSRTAQKIALGRGKREFGDS